MFISWGQSALVAERLAFDRVCDVLGVPVDMRHTYTVGFEWRNRPDLIDGNRPFPVARNLVLLSVISAAATTSFPTCQATVAVGFTADDTATDTRADFVAAFNDTLRTAVDLNRNQERIRIVAPLRGLTKAAAVAWASEMGLQALFAATWSCWKSGPTPCGSCGACVKRREAFAQAAIGDPGGACAWALTR